MLRPALLILLVTVGGCDSSTFTMIAPVPARITVDQPFDLAVAPLKYQFLTTDGRLIVLISNPTDDTIRLVGADSSAVDPDGRSHPLVSETLAPRSFVKLILPRPRPFGTGGPVRFGFILSGYPGGARYGYPDGQPDEADAPELPADTFDSPVYWDWPGNRPPVRINFVFRRSGSVFSQGFNLRKEDR